MGSKPVFAGDHSNGLQRIAKMLRSESNLSNYVTELARKQRASILPLMANGLMSQPLKSPAYEQLRRLSIPNWSMSPILDSVKLHIADSLKPSLLAPPDIRFTTGMSEATKALTWLSETYGTDRLGLRSIATNVLRALLPPNLRGIEGLSYSDVDSIIFDEGIPLYGVPSENVARSLLQAESNSERRSLIGSRWKQIANDCHQYVANFRSHTTADLRPFILATLDALRQGHVQAAQALAANLIDTLILRFYAKERKAFLVPSKKVRTSAGYEDLGAHEYLALGPIWPAYASFWVVNGDKIPRSFNRNATAHAVGSIQFSRRNAVIATMLATSLLGFLDVDARTAAFR